MMRGCRFVFLGFVAFMIGGGATIDQSLRADEQQAAPDSIAHLADECRVFLSVYDNGTDQNLSHQEQLDTVAAIGSCTKILAGVSLGFQIGVLAVTGEPPGPQTNGFCDPEGITNAERARVFVAWADANPDQVHLYKAYGIAWSFSQAWPCKGPGG